MAIDDRIITTETTLESVRHVLLTAVDFAFAVVASFLLGRFLLRFLGANSGAPFVAWIYEASSRLMIPFRAIFPDLFLGGGSVIDMSALVSLVFYAFIFYLLSLLVNLVMFSSTEVHQEVHSHLHRHIFT